MGPLCKAPAGPIAEGRYFLALTRVADAAQNIPCIRQLGLNFWSRIASQRARRTRRADMVPYPLAKFRKTSIRIFMGASLRVQASNP